MSIGSTIPRSAANSASSASLRYSPSSDGASISALSDQEADAQDALAHEAADCESLAQEAEAQEAEAQDALAQLAWFQDAEAQEAFDQEALAQDALAEAVLAQLAALKTLPPETSVVTNLFSAAFGFEGARERDRLRDVDHADACRERSRIAGRPRRHHQCALDLIGRPRGMH